MQHWLGLTARAAREAQGVSVTQIAAVLGVRELTITRFEDGSNKAREPDQVLAAYAAVLDIADPLMFYEIAVANWRGAGPPARPIVEEWDRPTSRAVEAARRAARHSASSGDGSLEKLIAIPLPLGFVRSV